jgi:hypothetical protein
VAERFGEAAGHLTAQVRLLRVSGAEGNERGGPGPRAGQGDLEWADGNAFRTAFADRGGAVRTALRLPSSASPPHRYATLVDIFVSLAS